LQLDDVDYVAEADDVGPVARLVGKVCGIPTPNRDSALRGKFDVCTTTATIIKDLGLPGD